MSDIWDEFQSDYVTFKNIGDAVAGEIISLSKASDFNGNPCPQLIIRNDAGEPKTVTAGQVMLRAKLAELRPTVGDRIGIVYSSDGPGSPGKAPAKLFTVQVRRATGELIGDNAAPVAQAPATPPAPPQAPPATPAVGSLV